MIAAGADYKITNDYHQTPLFFASKRLLKEYALMNKNVMEIHPDDFKNITRTNIYKIKLNQELEELLEEV